MVTEVESKIVCDALALMRQNIEDQYNDVISNLPRHGKGVATARDHDSEHEVLRRIKSIDALIETYSKDNLKSNANAQPARSDIVLSPIKDDFTGNAVQDYEPYINPFTGQWVIPDNPDKAGPSGITGSALSASSSSPRPSLGNEYSAFNSTSIYATPIPAPRSAEKQDLDSIPVDSEASANEASSGVASCDALWEAFGDDPLFSQSHAYSSDGSTNRSISMSSSSPGCDLSVPIPAENSWLTALDRQEIERSLREFEDQLELNGWSRPVQHDETVSQNGHASGPTVVPEVMLAQVPTQQHQSSFDLDLQMAVKVAKDDVLFPWPEQTASVWSQFDQENNNLFGLDRRKALELAGDVPQDYQQLLQAQQGLSHEERQQLQAIQDEMNRRDQEDMETALAQVWKLQDDWNRDADQTIRQEQDMARQIAEQEDIKDNAARLKELRRMQEQMQAEDNRLFEEDLRLARQLADMEGGGGFAPTPEAFQTPTWTEPPPYTETPLPGAWTDAVRNPTSPQQEARRLNPFRRLKKKPPPAVNQSPVSAVTPAFFSMSNNSTLRTADNVQSPPLRRATQSRRAASSRSTDGVAVPQMPQATSNEPTLSATDRDNISASLSVARNLQNTWEEERRKNEAAARAAQKEVRRIEEQARREMEHLRREEEKRRLAELRRQEEERKARLAKTADCSVCSETLDKDQMCRLACNHYYCRECLARSIQTSIKDKKAFRCCKRQVDVPTVSQWLPPQVTSSYDALTEELGTPNPTYCHIKKCSAFISPAQYTGDVARCLRCSNETCRLCKQKIHPGVICKQDTAGQALLNLGNKKKWTQCPHCKTMVERRAGCLHMTCRCGTQFCYNCGRVSSQCGGERCSRR